MNQWFEEKFEEKLQLSPLLMTYQGRKDRYDQVDDLSKEGEEKFLAWQMASVQELKKAFDYSKLDPEAQTSFDLWVYGVEQAQAVHLYHSHHFLFSENQNAFALPVQFLMRFHRVDDERDMQSYIKRISGIALALDQLVARAQDNAAKGCLPPKFLYEDLMVHVDSILAGDPFSKSEKLSPLWADALAQIKALTASQKIDQKTSKILKDQTRRALVTHLQPSLQRFRLFIQSEFKRLGDPQSRVFQKTQAALYYQQRLAQHTTTYLTAEEIHRLGLMEVERLEGEMRKELKRLKFRGTLVEFRKHLNALSDQKFPETDEGRENYLAVTQGYLRRMEKKLPRYFRLRPKFPLEVKRVEPLREKAGASNHYFPGSLDGKTPGIFYLHLVSMQNLPRYLLEATAYHEGLPGHHVQTSLAMELAHLPSFRKLAFFSAYVEGWGLYAEELAREMGGYQDGYSNFGRLSLEMWRAARMVVDTGLHAKEWTQDQAMRFYSEKTALPENVIQSEVRRNLLAPGRAVSYQIGKMNILELRAKAQKELGSKFDIKKFHDTILSGGALPLSFLEKRVDAYIKASL